MIRSDKDENLDQDVIDGFGREWAAFDYVKTNAKEALDTQFKAYCSPIDLAQFNIESAVAAANVSWRFCSSPRVSWNSLQCAYGNVPLANCRCT